MTIVQVGTAPDRWVVVSDYGQNLTRPCTWKFAVRCVGRWTEFRAW